MADPSDPREVPSRDLIAKGLLHVKLISFCAVVLLASSTSVVVGQGRLEHSGESVTVVVNPSLRMILLWWTRSKNKYGDSGFARMTPREATADSSAALRNDNG